MSKDFFDQVPEITKTTEQFKQSIIDASKVAIEHLIEVLREPIIGREDTEDISADRLKSAASTKKIAMFDALEMIARIDVEETNLKEGKDSNVPAIGFAEKNAK